MGYNSISPRRREMLKNIFRNKKMEALERRVQQLENLVGVLDERTLIEVELDYVPYFDPRFPVNSILAQVLSRLGLRLYKDGIIG
jgi:hypothetical protein